MKIKPGAIFLCAFFPLLAQADEITIDADEKVEWHREQQKIVAIGNAVAVQNGSTANGQVLTAFYETVQLEDGRQQNQISRLMSDSGVKLSMSGTVATGEHFDYDMQKGKAVLTGTPAKLVNKKGELTAEKSITYYPNENRAVALGNVIARNPDYTIYADKMISFFDDGKDGKKSLRRIEIYAEEKPVKIVNAQATVTGKKGIYFPLENKLKIYENVVITQNNDILKGDYAETDIATGISRLLSAGKGKRVSGVFHNKKK